MQHSNNFCYYGGGGGGGRVDICKSFVVTLSDRGGGRGC